MELNNDLKLQLVSGLPIFVKGVGNVYPLTIQEIGMCVESKYNSVIGMFTRTLDDLDLDDQQLKSGLTYFDFLIYTCIKDDLIRAYCEEVLSSILREKVSVHKENFCFFIGDINKMVDSDKVRLIDKQTFEDLSDVLRFQNCIEKTKPKPKKKTNAKVEMLKKKRSQGRQLLQEAKGEDFCMADILSTLGVYYMDLEKVTKLTVYQVNDQYNKFMRKEKYERQYSVYVAGADPKKLDLDTHWSAKQKVKDMDNTAPPRQ